MFRIENLVYQEILDINELRIKPGMTALLGPSGCGTSTLLRLLNKLASPDAGRIFYKGVDIAEVPSVEHRRRVMMLSQSPVLFPGNIRDNLEVGFRLQKTDTPGDARLREILAQVRLDKDLDGPSELLSGGERQRLVLARVCLLDPEVYLLDEPSAALDEHAEDELVAMVKTHIRSEGKSAVMVTHSRRVAERYADDLLVMGKGGHTWRA